MDFQMDIHLAGFMLDMDRHSHIRMDKMNLRNSCSALKRMKNSLKGGRNKYAKGPCKDGLSDGHSAGWSHVRYGQTDMNYKWTN